MELANGKKNKFFTLKSEGENRYYIENFDAEKTKGLNNVYLLAKEVPENSIVLDIGCAQGRFGRILKEKKCIVYGIELDEKAAGFAKQSGYYDEVYVMDITNEDTDEYKKFIHNIKEVDVIIISDVFEHIAEPTSLLMKYYTFLKENGMMLVSVPNIAHIDILLNLLNDKFNYQDMGILDNTHLKFFTKSSFIDWIDQINDTYKYAKLDCEYLGATFYNNKFLDKIKKDYKELFLILEHSYNYNAFQILFKITKIPLESSPVQLEKLKNESSIDVVEMLGNVLKGKINRIENNKTVKGERLWYEKRIEQFEESISWYKNRVKELEKAIEWHQENDTNIRESLNWHIEKVKELEKAIEWHQENDANIRESLNWYIENDRNLKNLIEEKEKDFENQRYKDRQELLELRKKIFGMENSRIWRWTKFLRKDEK